MVISKAKSMIAKPKSVIVIIPMIVAAFLMISHVLACGPAAPGCPECYRWNGSKCVPCSACCNGECCSGSCCDGSCCGPSQTCCNGSCSSSCWTLEGIGPSTVDTCGCAAGVCSGTYVWIELHTCKASDSGYTKCELTNNVTVGSYWVCTDTPNYLGIIDCWLLNGTVCTIQCAGAVTACLQCPGCWECIDALMSCYGCVTGEGIDCGCLTVTCVYPATPTGPITGSDQRLSGCSCP